MGKAKLTEEEEEEEEEPVAQPKRKKVKEVVEEEEEERPAKRGKGVPHPNFIQAKRGIGVPHPNFVQQKSKDTKADEEVNKERAAKKPKDKNADEELKKESAAKKPKVAADGADKKLSLKEKKRLKKGPQKASDPAAVAAPESKGKTAAKGSQVEIDGLPFSAKETELREFFEKCGEIADVSLLGRRLGKAVVSFAGEDGLEAALKMDGKEFGKRWIQVCRKGKGHTKGKGKGAKGLPPAVGDEGGGEQGEERRIVGGGGGGGGAGRGGAAKGKSKGKKGGSKDDKGVREFEVFVAGLPFAAGEQQIRKTFGECGEIDRFIMPLNADGQSKGIACISYTDAAGFESASALDKTEFCGITILVHRRVEHKKGEGKGKNDGKGKGQGNIGCRDFEVMIGGLPWSSEADKVKSDFAECGEITRISMPSDEEGQSKGLAFVSFATAEGMEKALKFHETDYGGVYIRVMRANAPRGGGFDRGSFARDSFDRGQSQAKALAGSDSGGKGQKGKGKVWASHAAFANSQGVIVESTGTKTTFDDSDAED